jgi:hypothetical protein
MLTFVHRSGHKEKFHQPHTRCDDCEVRGSTDQDGCVIALRPEGCTINTRAPIGITNHYSQPLPASASSHPEMANLNKKECIMADI